jgi:hypothetical protein
LELEELGEKHRAGASNKEDGGDLPLAVTAFLRLGGVIDLRMLVLESSMDFKRMSLHWLKSQLEHTEFKSARFGWVVLACREKVRPS